jgi:hypothetical protein
MKPKTETTTASLAVVGVDIGMEVFHLVGLGSDGTIAFRRKIRRLSLKDVFERLPACVVGMEACLSAHFVSMHKREDLIVRELLPVCELMLAPWQILWQELVGVGGNGEMRGRIKRRADRQRGCNGYDRLALTPFL